jgi:NAD-dependent dihydropyrimidine dehydrogenase PreA subunit
VVKTRYGVDDEICTGDHSCIRLSGCPSLTVKPNPDPLRTDPVAAVIESCVGCGLCGEVAHAAVLCPSFFKTDVISNPTWWDRALFRMRSAVIGWMRGNAETSSPSSLGGKGREPSPKQTAAPLPPREQPLRAVGAQTSSVRPMTILIAALGGEGGGVLTDWIVAAAESQKFPVSRSEPARPPITSRWCLWRGRNPPRARCWRWRPVSPTSISWWRAN